jgi:hypothetical protein
MMQHSEEDAPITDEITAPRSDQLNADDLLAGPKLIVITRVSEGNSEQPRHIHYVGGEGRPWKPCKTMMRVLKEHWGATGYRGRSVLLVRDPAVSFGKDKNIGGIRIAGLSHIPADTQSTVTISRGQRKSTPIKRLEAAEAMPTKPRGDIASALSTIEKWSGDTKPLRSAIDGKLETEAWSKTERAQIKAALDALEQRQVEGRVGQ